jgi:hypothetical protein
MVGANVLRLARIGARTLRDHVQRKQPCRIAPTTEQFFKTGQPS